MALGIFKKTHDNTPAHSIDKQIIEDIRRYIRYNYISEDKVILFVFPAKGTYTDITQNSRAESINSAVLFIKGLLLEISFPL